MKSNSRTFFLRTLTKMAKTEIATVPNDAIIAG
jgi:hypothetical protein